MEGTIPAELQGTLYRCRCTCTHHWHRTNLIAEFYDDAQ